MPELFKVNSITKRVKLTATGEFLDVYEVSFTTKSGIIGSVEIPAAQFNKERVNEAITAEATELEGVMSL